VGAVVSLLDLPLNLLRRKIGVEDAIRRAGGAERLPMLGPRLDRFEPLSMADALEHEIERMRAEGWPVISFSMTLDDAGRMMRYFRKHR